MTEWDSFNQRPHHFVNWYHQKTGQKVMWVNTYPTRLPEIADFIRLIKNSDKTRLKNATHDWLEVVNLNALPIEPLPGLNNLNKILWRQTLEKVRDFTSSNKTIVVISKPSRFSLDVLENCSVEYSLYDVMDDYPAFYKGCARRQFIENEKKIAARVDEIWISCTNLYRKFPHNENIKLVLNGCLGSDIMEILGDTEQEMVNSYRFGYVGAMGSWFDWDWLCHLARIRPNDSILVVGPILSKVNLKKIPPNVTFKPACTHYEAIKYMNMMQCGLIPFKINAVTEAVDPIKYYEYKSLGIPVLSSSFGQMTYRKKEQGVYLTSSEDMNRTIESVSFEKMNSLQRKSFIQENCWDSRFDKSNLINEM